MRERVHVLYAVAASRLQRDRALPAISRQSKRSMPRRVAVDVAEALGVWRSGGAGFGEAPAGAELFADAMRVDQHVRLGGRAKAGRETLQPQQSAPRRLRVDHAAAQEI